MKHTFFLLLSCLFVATAATAQRSQLSVQLSDGSPLTININDRDYKKVSTRILIKDIPRKRQDIKVYKYRPYSDGNGGKAELVFSGRIKLEPGNNYMAIVDPKARKLSLQKVDGNTLLNTPIAPPKMTKPNFRNDVAISVTKGKYDQTPIIQKLKRLDTDTEKKKSIDSYLQNNKISCDELGAICESLLFEDSKLEVIKKHGNSSVTDPENLSSLTYLFSDQNNQKAFQKLIK